MTWGLLRWLLLDSVRFSVTSLKPYQHFDPDAKLVKMSARFSARLKLVLVDFQFLATKHSYDTCKHTRTQQFIRCVYYLSHHTLCKDTRSTAMHCHLLKWVATSVLACLTWSYTAGESWVIHNTCNVSGSQLVQDRAAVNKEEKVSWVEKV